MYFKLNNQPRKMLKKFLILIVLAIFLSNCAKTLRVDLAWEDNGDLLLTNTPLNFENIGESTPTILQMKVSGLDACSADIQAFDASGAITSGFALTSFTSYRNTSNNILRIADGNPTPCNGLTGTATVVFSVDGKIYTSSITKSF